MNAQPAFLMYRCRLCEQIFEVCRVPDARQGLAVAEGNQVMPSNWGGQRPGALTLHHDCPEGEIGVADLAGARPIVEDEDDE